MYMHAKLAYLMWLECIKNRLFVGILSNYTVKPRYNAPRYNADRAVTRSVVPPDFLAARCFVFVFFNFYLFF